MHRAAWPPASLPYAAQYRPTVEPGATSSFTRAAYDVVRETWLYDPAFDLVADAPNGSMVACCIAWYDPASGVAEIEPLGVVPEHPVEAWLGLSASKWRRGLARRAAEKCSAIRGTGPDYPAPGRVYARAGFETFARANMYVCSR